MKILTRSLCSLFFSLCLVLPALAGFQDNSAAQPGNPGGGFQGPGSASAVTTVAQALKAPDDTPCTLEGYIIQRSATDHDDYVFRDATGQIVVEIDHKIFMGRTITPETRVRLHGKVDKEVLRPNEVDVKILEIIAAQ